MTDQRHHTTGEPSVWPFLRSVAMTMFCLGLNIWIQSDHDVDIRRLVGAVAWFWYTAHHTGKAIDRFAVWRQAVKGRQERNRQTSLDSVGTWTTSAGELFTVRWSTMDSMYLVKGRVPSMFPLPEEMICTDVDGLALMIEEAEQLGTVPKDDEGTRAIRARLDIPGWDGTDPIEARRLRDELNGRGGR